MVNTEDKILEAANTIFLEKGFDGARMQDIANEAGINKALLHYYFRSKEKLFDAVFSRTVVKLMPILAEFLTSDKAIEIKIRNFVSDYIDLIQANPMLPIFVLYELKSNSDKITGMLNLQGMLDTSVLRDQLREGNDKGHLKPVDPKHFMVNLLSMTVFPFVAKPLLQSNFKIDDPSWGKFIEERKKIIPETILSWIKSDNTVK